MLDKKLSKLMQGKNFQFKVQWSRKDIVESFCTTALKNVKDNDQSSRSFGKSQIDGETAKTLFSTAVFKNLCSYFIFKTVNSANIIAWNHRTFLTMRRKITKVFERWCRIVFHGKKDVMSWTRNTFLQFHHRSIGMSRINERNELSKAF